ncbi:MAG TPA: hypothetical protein P5325_01880, partial [Candidatus Woesebacteria bacterium]|nr:hypothetical protein [Candidatus Woesebacteria bacterium]
MTKKNSSFLLWQFPPLFHCQKQGDACLPLGRWQSLFISLVLVLAFSFLFAPPALARDFQVKDTSGNTLFIIKGDVANVGIGTAGPASKLSVNGGISVGSYYATAAPSNGMIISGNVGIGKTNPGASLDVNGAAKVLSFTLPTGAGEGKVLASDGDGTGFWKSLSEVSGVIGDGLTGQVTFWKTSSEIGGDNDLFWDITNKRLGIGTTSPTGKLEVSHNGTDRDLVVSSTNGRVGIYDPAPANRLSVDGDIAGSGILKISNEGKSYIQGQLAVGSTNPGGVTLDVNGNFKAKELEPFFETTRSS